QTAKLLAILNECVKPTLHRCPNLRALGRLFALPLEQLTEPQRTQILTAVHGRLHILIQDGNQLNCLFELPLEKLSEPQRTQILTAVQGRLHTLIQDGEQLRRLFALPLEQLTEPQRTQIWSAAVQRRLHTLI